MDLLIGLLLFLVICALTGVGAVRAVEKWGLGTAIFLGIIAWPFGWPVFFFLGVDELLNRLSERNSQEE